MIIDYIIYLKKILINFCQLIIFFYKLDFIKIFYLLFFPIMVVMYGFLFTF